jgi:hypothetical protein
MMQTILAGFVGWRIIHKVERATAPPDPPGLEMNTPHAGFRAKRMTKSKPEHLRNKKLKK